MSAPSNGYGLTETSSVTTMNSGDDYVRQPDSVGPPVPVCDVAVVPDGFDGEEPTDDLPERPRRHRRAVDQGAQRRARLLEQARGHRRHFTKGWLHSGDVARIDEDGFVYIVDRAKDMVIRGGENVYSVEVEAALFEHPAVADAAVIGVPHAVLGEEVGAAVVLAAGRQGDRRGARPSREGAPGGLQGAHPHLVPVRAAPPQSPGQGPEARAAATLSATCRSSRDTPTAGVRGGRLLSGGRTARRRAGRGDRRRVGHRPGRLSALRRRGGQVAVLDIDETAAQATARRSTGSPSAVDVTDAEAMRRGGRHRRRSARWGVAPGEQRRGQHHGRVGRLGPRRVGPARPAQPDRGVQRHAGGRPPSARRGGGAVVNTSSISATRPSAGETPYSAAKAGVIALTSSAALEYGPVIRVNAVAPGMIRTNLTRPLLEVVPDADEHYGRTTPAGRVGEPEDVADVMVFLCSDLARFITGQTLVVDGGMTLHGAGVDGLFDRFFGAATP